MHVTPYSISFVIRKRQQIDNLYELPKEKRPPDKMIWEGTPEDIDEWLDRVFKVSGEKENDIIITDVED